MHGGSGSVEHSFKHGVIDFTAGSLGLIINNILMTLKIKCANLNN
jgi:hypothetical protein